MIELIDQTGRQVAMANHPNRIISIVPSQTELLFHLGLGKKLIGRTRFCIHPMPEVSSVKRVGGTKTLNLEEIKSLKPDLIIANKEENDKSQIDELSKEFPVYLSDIVSFESSLKMIQDISILTDTKLKGEQLVGDIKKEFDSVPRINGKVAYLIWYNPAMVAAKNTFIDELLVKLGLENAFENDQRYPEKSLEDLGKAAPDYILLSSEPYPFKEKHKAELSSYAPKSKIFLVDGEMFSWYGSRMLLAANYFKKLAAQLL